jgi:hypothetical protein
VIVLLSLPLEAARARSLDRWAVLKAVAAGMALALAAALALRATRETGATNS